MAHYPSFFSLFCLGERGERRPSARAAREGEARKSLVNKELEKSCHELFLRISLLENTLW